MLFLSHIHSKSKTLNEILIVLGGVFLLFAASQIEVPLKPVPITLQTVAVMLIGLTYSPRHTLESHLIWVGLGAAGFPVFAGFAGGVAHLASPTAGYIIGFVIAAFFMAKLKEKYKFNSWISDALLCTAGTTLIFAFGIAWLAQFLGIKGALVHGLLPFILPGLIKAGLLCTGLQIIRYYCRG